MSADIDSLYRLEPYDPAHHDAVVRLQQGLWGPDLEANRRYLQWKYLENPFIREPLMSLAFHEGELVGMRGMFGSRWSVGRDGQEVTLPVAGDTVIRPEHQSRGLFRRMTAALLEEVERRGHPFALNLSGSPPTSLRSMRLGWRRVGSYEMVRRGRWHRLAGLVASALPVAGVGLAATPDFEEMSRLAGARAAADRIRHVSTPEYFRWRFRNPLFRYRFLFLGGGSPEGYLVLQGRRGSSRQAIIDWEAPDEPGAERLLRGAIRAAGGHSLGTWAGDLTRTWPDLLRRRHFSAEDQSGRSKRYEPGLLVVRASSKDWTLDGLTVRDPGHWDVRMVASDEF